ncbi:MAG: ImmA/IrrE family metallo-endopeptidase, partial [Actinomycetia bacterium]|nr:ImmA/IrrE family metallo-endopeptidase [Actinomycetes bacterium]
EFPAIVIRRDLSADRKRFNIAHEIAHDYTGTDDEKLAHRFAAAFLLPPETVFSEIGEKRRKLNLTELLELKKKHGVSIQAWVRRAYDLGVITEESYQNTFRWISRKGWRRNEPGEYCFPEEPVRFRQLVLRTLSEGMITNAWANHLLPDMEYTPIDTQLSRLMKMSDIERAEALSPILDRAAEDYLKSEDLTDLRIAEEPDDYE